MDALVAAGLEVHDAGDLPKQTWKPDRAHPYAQNLEQVATCLRELTNRLSPLLATGDTVLVLGGNCTIALSVMAGLQRLDDATPGLLYIDRHFDLNTPESTTDGALDWMGLAHGLALPVVRTNWLMPLTVARSSSRIRCRGSESIPVRRPSGSESRRIGWGCT
jgi:arginase